MNRSPASAGGCSPTRSPSDLRSPSVPRRSPPAQGDRSRVPPASLEAGNGEHPARLVASPHTAAAFGRGGELIDRVSGWHLEPRLVRVACPLCACCILVIAGSSAWCASCPDRPVLEEAAT
jgi:hypothetical protein